MKIWGHFLCQFFLQNLLDSRWIGFAMRLFHDLANEEANNFHFAILVVFLGFLSFWLGKDCIYDGFERAKVVFLDNAEFLGDFLGVFKMHFWIEELDKDFFATGGAELVFVEHGSEVGELGGAWKRVV